MFEILQTVALSMNTSLAQQVMTDMGTAMVTIGGIVGGVIAVVMILKIWRS